LEPWWALITGSIPFWMAFNTICSAETVENYLESVEKFEEIYLMMMSNGVDGGIGLTPIDRWRSILKKASKRGEFLGVDETKYPMDFGSFIRYHTDLKTKITDRFTPPSPLTTEELDQFLSETNGHYQVEWK
jgi:hypothetical protein